MPCPDEDERWLTTGGAAKLCSVGRGTVLKWIKRGRLAARRTAGGHYRIDRQDLGRVAGTTEPAEPEQQRPLRCWEYLNPTDQPTEECQKCVAFRVRAAWCFRLREIAGETGASFCSELESCEDCSYYRRVHGLSTRVLAITSDSTLLGMLRGDNKEDVAFCFAHTGYEAATLIPRFRPGLVVVDAEVYRGGGAEMVGNLASDSRNHGLKIVYALPHRPARGAVIPDADAVVQVIAKPFHPAELGEIVARYPVAQKSIYHGATSDCV